MHTDESAARAARAIDALAFTVGNHVVFGRAQYEPGSSAGDRLMAHELAHVVQQTASRAAPLIQRKVERAKCTKSRLSQDRCDMVEADNLLAMIYINKTLTALRAGKSSARLRKALRCYFNIKGTRHKKKLIAKLEFIQRYLSEYKAGFFYEKGYPVGCKTTAEGKPTAYARPASWTKPAAGREPRIVAYVPVGLCPLYFRLTDRPSRARVLIHEQGHVVGLVPRNGAKELRVGAKARRRLPTAKLMTSADGYAHFVIAVATGSFTGC